MAAAAVALVVGENKENKKNHVALLFTRRVTEHPQQSTSSQLPTPSVQYCCSILRLLLLLWRQCTAVETSASQSHDVVHFCCCNPPVVLICITAVQTKQRQSKAKAKAADTMTQQQQQIVTRE